MKKQVSRFILISTAFLFYITQNVTAQQNLAQDVYAIIEQSCLICHGENGSYRESLIIEHKALIENEKIIPGDPEGSVFYQRLIETDVAKRMPLGQPPLTLAAIETIHQWIAADAPDWNTTTRPNTDFITSLAMHETIEAHVQSLAPFDRTFARYFTSTHLYNAGETDETLKAYQRALSKLVNNLSWGRNVVKPQPIDVEQTIFYIDLRDYEWDVNQDGEISILDLVLVAQDLEADTSPNERTDVNGDGVINIQDIILVGQHISETEASAASPILAANKKELMPEMI